MGCQLPVASRAAALALVLAAHVLGGAPSLGAAEKNGAKAQPPTQAAAPGPQAKAPTDWRQQFPPAWEKWTDGQKAAWEKGLNWIKHVIVVRTGENNIGPGEASRILEIAERAARKGYDLKKIEEAMIETIEAGKAPLKSLQQRGITLELNE